MPSFAGLGDGQLQQLVSYVIFLSLRGEVEGRTISAIVKADPLEDPSAKEVEDYQRQQLHGRTNPEGNKVSFGLIDHWRAAQSSPVEVTPDPYQTPEARTDAAAAGFGLFINDQVGCAKCHINYGRTLNLRYDDWGTIVQPRNILDGRWRGGKDGRDLYVRIAGGIPGSGMPAHAILRPTEDEKRAGVDRLWQVVHFVRMAGNKAQRPKLVEKLKDKGLDPKFDD
jgi:mono/diheme cytochrome c family protein